MLGIRKMLKLLRCVSWVVRFRCGIETTFTLLIWKRRSGGGRIKNWLKNKLMCELGLAPLFPGSKELFLPFMRGKGLWSDQKTLLLRLMCAPGLAPLSQDSKLLPSTLCVGRVGSGIEKLRIYIDMCVASFSSFPQSKRISNSQNCSP